MTTVERRGPGRPPVPPEERRDRRVPVRLTADELDAIDAARGGEDRAAWMRAAALERARRGEP